MNEKVKADLILALLIAGVFFLWTLVGVPVMHYINPILGMIVMIVGIMGSIIYFAFVCKWTQKLDKIAKG